MPRMGPGTREQIGAAVLAAAKTVDARLVKRRLTTFAGEHRDYMEAQVKVEAAQGHLRAAQTRLAACDAAQGAAVEVLARALVGDGHPRVNPFNALGAAAPAAIRRLPAAKEVKAIRRLVASVQRRNGLSKTTVQAAQAADKASRAVEAALTSIDTLQKAVREMRRTRDAIGRTWEVALGALKRGARAAADDDAPRLYPTLFGRLSSAVRKRRKSKPVPAASPTTTTPA